MNLNILSKLSVTVMYSGIEPNPSEQLHIGLTSTDYVYSYLIYAQYTNGALTGWLVEFLVSQTTNYNTISVDDAIDDVSKIITDAWKETQITYVIGYRQPPIELLLETFDPLVKKLASKQKEYWRYLEYEDLCQICRMVICHLYNKGYYIHSKLISRAFTNEILMMIRPERYKPAVLSLDKVVDDEYEEVTLMDCIEDETPKELREEQEEREAIKRVLEKKKEIIIEALGGSERQYDQLVREYGNKSATPWARMAVQRVKKYLAKLSIDEESFSHLK